MMDQTGWDQNNQLPIGGPLSSQEWAFVNGIDGAATTIYASFRLAENKLQIWPQPTPEGLVISFEYISRNWLLEAGTGGQRLDRPQNGTNLVLFEPILMVKFLKLKFLSAKGFDTTTAARELDLMFGSRTGKDSGAPVLSAGGNGFGYPYLGPGNLPITKFGDWNGA
jgi:hypothetical protein